MAKKKVTYVVSPYLSISFEEGKKDITIAINEQSYVIDYKLAMELSEVLTEAHDEIQYYIDSEEDGE